MWREHDDNLYDKTSKHKHRDDRDIDIDININIDGDRKQFPPFGIAGGRRELDLNLCDVAKGLESVTRDRSAIGGAAGCSEFKEAIKEARVAKKEEPPFIDCGWDRMLNENQHDILQKSAKLGAALKGMQG